VIVEERIKKSSVCLIVSTAVLLLAVYLALDAQSKEVIQVVSKLLLFLGGLCAVLAAACATVVIVLRAVVRVCGVPCSPLTLRVLRQQMLVVLLTGMSVWSAMLVVLQQYGIIADPGYAKIPTASIVIAGFGAGMLGTCLSSRPFFHWIAQGVLPDRWRDGIHALVFSAFAFTAAMFAIMSISGTLQP
jgi:hypothetical protein